MSENRSPEIGKLILALSKAQREIDGAIKDSKNPFFKTSYADLYACISAAKKPLADNELAVIQTIWNAEGNGIKITTILGHSSGQWIQSELTMYPKKNDDQGRGSSITYGRRYSFAAIIGLAQKDDDGNASCKGDETKPETKQPPKAQKKFSADWEIIFDAAKINTMEDMISWRKKNGAEILKTLDKAEQSKFKKYLASCEQLILEEKPAGIECPETGLMSTQEQCQKAKCSTDFFKCSKGKTNINI